MSLLDTIKIPERKYPHALVTGTLKARESFTLTPGQLSLHRKVEGDIQPYLTSGDIRQARLLLSEKKIPEETFLGVGLGKYLEMEHGLSLQPEG